MRKLLFVFLILFSFLTCNHAQENKWSDAIVKDINFFLNVENQLEIIFSIQGGAASDRFNVNLSVFASNGTKLNSKTISGDIENVSRGNNKKILWDIEKDVAFLDDDIYVEIEIEHINPKSVASFSKGKAMIYSTILPGSGSAKISSKKIHYLKGIASYTLLALSVSNNYKSYNAYEDYKIATDADARQTLFSESESKNNISKLMFYGAATVWVAEYVNILAMKNRSGGKKNNVSFSPDYNPVNGDLSIRLCFNF